MNSPTRATLESRIPRAVSAAAVSFEIGSCPGCRIITTCSEKRRTCKHTYTSSWIRKKRWDAPRGRDDDRGGEHRESVAGAPRLFAVASLLIKYRFARRLQKAPYLFCRVWRVKSRTVVRCDNGKRLCFRGPWQKHERTMDHKGRWLNICGQKIRSR